MAKSNDIVGTIRIPEAGYGRFWNFMKTMPGGEFTPQLQAEAPAKRNVGKTADGTTNRCIVLRYLASNSNVSSEDLGVALITAEKSPKSLPGLINALKGSKAVVSKGRGKNTRYSITPKGRTYLKKSCPNA